MRRCYVVIVVFLFLQAVGTPATKVYCNHLFFTEVVRNGINGVEGLSSVYECALSPDGKFLYAVSYADDALVVFRRDVDTGTLEFVEMLQDGINGVDGLEGVFSIVVSPDGKHVYTASWFDDAVAVFERNTLTGTLSYTGYLYHEEIDGVGWTTNAPYMKISNDGNNIYTAGTDEQAIAVFSRDSATGALTHLESVKEGVDGVQGLASTCPFALSPDGKNLYIGSWADKAITVFERNTETGALTFLEMHKDGINGVDGLGPVIYVAVSPDGLHVYTTGQQDKSINLFSRDEDTGSLTLIGTQEACISGEGGEDMADSLTFSPDGLFAYVAWRDKSALSVCKRDTDSGSLILRETKKNGYNSVDGLDGVWSVSISSDGKNIYAPGPYDHAIAVFSRNSMFPWTLFMPSIFVQKK